MIVGLLVFLVGFTTTSLLSAAVANQAERDFDASLRQRSTALEMHYRSQMASYSRLLYSASTLFDVKPSLGREDWQVFYDRMRVEDRFPGMRSLGYAAVVKESEREEHSRMLSDATGSEIAIPPAGDRSDYAVVTYVAPNSVNIRGLIGYDLLTDAARKEALDRTKRTGDPAMTQPVVLLSDKDKKDQANKHSVIIYQAVYVPGADLSTEAARTQALRGYVYVTVEPGDILADYRKSGNSSQESIRVVLQDVTEAKPIEVYKVDTLSRAAGRKDKAVSRFTVDGREWRLEVGDSYAPLSRIYGPASIFLFGGLVSAFLGLVFYVGLRNRFLRVHNEYEKEVQRTKDELLALASHQLRTPASGVKQYVGMLTSGLMGELTPTQLSIAQKAYDANERQIQIISELLYVSKADAGELHIEFADMDMTKLIHEAVDDIAEQAKAKDISLVFTARKPRRIQADQRYITMIIENLISNAIKYSYSGTTVHITLHENESTVSVDIKDQGVGIAKDDLRRLFSKFDRIPNPLSYSEGGSGLGLFLARQLALAHGGDITVASEQGTGSTFTLTLPKVPGVTSATANIKR